jgi:uncharacterized protein with PIN domain
MVWIDASAYVAMVADEKSRRNVPIEKHVGGAMCAESFSYVLESNFPVANAILRSFPYPAPIADFNFVDERMKQAFRLLAHFGTSNR